MKILLMLMLSSTCFALSFSDAERLFHELKTQANIPYDFPDGCHAKAHAAVRYMENQGVIAQKIFIEGNLFYRNSWEPSFWTFHVVPTIEVEDRDEPVVFDLFVFDRPVVLSELIAALKRAPQTNIREVYFTSRYIYSPAERDLPINTYEDYFLRDMETELDKIRRRIEARQP